MHNGRLFVIFGLIITAMISRLLPLPPNCTAMNAVALFSVFSLGNRKLALCIVYIAMLMTDFILGLHSQMLFVYFSLSMTIVLKGFRLPLPLSMSCSSLFFFIVVNFGVWLLDGMYPMTWSGLLCCYVAALPFLGNQLLGDLLYGMLLFGSLSVAERLFPAIRHRSLLESL